MKQLKRFLPRKVAVFAGVILALTALMYFATWLVSGDQQTALHGAGIMLCFLLAFAVIAFAVNEVSK